MHRPIGVGLCRPTRELYRNSDERHAQVSCEITCLGANPLIAVYTGCSKIKQNIY